MQRVLVHDALRAAARRLFPTRFPPTCWSGCSSSTGARRCSHVHFPPEGADVDELNRFASPAQRRLIFEEFFLFQLGLILRKRRAAAEQKPRAVRIIRRDPRCRCAACCRSGSPGTRRRSIAEIVADMQRLSPMNRLLQGDVGSGKTIVALMAAVVAMENGFQVAFMAPTEILAEQHFITIRRLLESSRFRITLLTGSTPARQRREAQAELSAGSLHLVVGTHALVEDPIALPRARAGHHRRAAPLRRDAAGDAPCQGRASRRAGDDRDADPAHARADRPTATSTCRSCARCRRADSRSGPLAKPESRRDEIYDFVRTQIDAGRQAYVIYPLVEESEKVDLRAATEMADHLAQEVFPAYRVALLHGR